MAAHVREAVAAEADVLHGLAQQGVGVGRFMLLLRTRRSSMVGGGGGTIVERVDLAW
jgi:hypothetical protein